MDLNIKNLITDFELFASENGYNLPPGAIAGFIDKASPLRFSKDGGRDKDSFAYLHSHGVGTLGDWHDFAGSKVVYNFFDHTDTPISEEERQTLEIEAKEQAQRAEAERELQWRDKALQCAEEFSSLPIASSPFGYFEAKGFETLAGDIRKKGDIAVIPFYNEKGNISTLQFIHPDGRKEWKPGAKKSGAFFPLGLENVRDLERFFMKRVFLCEGVATALSVYLATKSPTIAVGDVGNHINISRLFPNSVIIADHDVPSHIGETKAQETGKPYILMSDPENYDRSFDADDFRKKYGIEKLADRIYKDYSPYFLTLPHFRKVFKSNGYVVKNVINESTVNCFFGPSNTGKTYVMLDLALSVATRKEAWHGAKIHGGLVIYFCAEGQAALPQRIDAWCDENGVDKELLDSCFLLRGVPDNLSDKGKIDILLSEIEALNETPVLICLDTFIRFLEGDEKNSQDVIRLLNNFEDINKEGIAILYTNHPGKNPDSQDKQTGSYRNYTNIDNEFTLSSIDDETILLQQSKSRNGQYYELKLSLPIVTMGLDDDGDEITQRVVKTLSPISLMGKKTNQRDSKPKEKRMSSKQSEEREQLISIISDQFIIDEPDDEKREAYEKEFIQNSVLSISKMRKFMVSLYKKINPGVSSEKIEKKVNDMLNPNRTGRNKNFIYRLQKYGYVTDIITDEDDIPALIRFDSLAINGEAKCNTVWCEIRMKHKILNEKLWQIPLKNEE